MALAQSEKINYFLWVAIVSVAAAALLAALAAANVFSGDAKIYAYTAAAILVFIALGLGGQGYSVRANYKPIFQSS
jgi:hypothetical protein